VRGCEESILAFVKTILIRVTEATVDRVPGYVELGDTILVLRFRPPVPMEYAIAEVIAAAGQTGVFLAGVSHDASVE
jgi:hypothetical protein